MNTTTPMASGKGRRLMGCTHSSIDPASRFRFLLYVPHLEKAGWRISHRPNVPSRYWRLTAKSRRGRSVQKRVAKFLGIASRWRDIIDSARHDAVFINRDLLDGQLQWEQRMIRHNPRVIFDFDDAIFLGETRKNHIEWICQHAAWVTVGNETLAQFARNVTDRVTIIPSVIDAEKYVPSRHDFISNPVRVGWLGSDLSIRETLFQYLDMFSRLQQQLGFEFVIVSKPRPELPASSDLRWRYMEWSPSVEENISEHLDIGLMPLVDDEFQRGKCGMKLLQYMGGALPTIATPLGANCDIVQHGKTGFLANSEAEWHDAIDAFMRSPALRKEFGMKGRSLCEKNYSIQAWVPKLLEILDRVASDRLPT